MGYGTKFPTNLVESPNLWVIRGYGLLGLWVKRGSTVPLPVGFKFLTNYLSRLQLSALAVRPGLNTMTTTVDEDGSFAALL
jgi:hypothetical protein